MNELRALPLIIVACGPTAPSRSNVATTTPPPPTPTSVISVASAATDTRAPDAAAPETKWARSSLLDLRSYKPPRRVRCGETSLLALDGPVDRAPCAIIALASPSASPSDTKIVQTSAHQIQSCGDSALFTDANVEGTARFDLLLDVRGEVRNVTTSQVTGLAPATSCMASALESLWFDAGAMDRTVTVLVTQTKAASRSP